MLLLISVCTERMPVAKTGGQREFATKSTENGVRFNLQHPRPVEYKGVCLDNDYHVDQQVEDKFTIELKNVECIKGRFPKEINETHMGLS